MERPRGDVGWEIRCWVPHPPVSEGADFDFSQRVANYDFLSDAMSITNRYFTSLFSNRS